MARERFKGRRFTRTKRYDRKPRRAPNACRGKARYGSYDEAQRANPSHQVYQCQSCGCFHLTAHPLVW